MRLSRSAVPMVGMNLLPATSAFLRASSLALLLHALPAFAFDLQGHRGARGLAPENTLAAFERALALGVTTLELDVALTADNVAVVSHDPALNPAITRDASGRWLAARGPLIRSLTRAQLAAWDVGRIDPGSSYARGFPEQQGRDGERIPTLAEVFALTRRLGAHEVRFNIEIKTDPTRPADTAPPQAFVDAIVVAAREAGALDRVVIQSFDWNALRLVQQSAPSVPTAYLSTQTARADNTRDTAWNGGLLWRDHASVPHMVRAAGGTIWSPNAPALTEALVRQAQALGLKVIPWTVNESADMLRLIDWGVDGLITDHPERLREALARRGQALPAPIPSPR